MNTFLLSLIFFLLKVAHSQFVGTWLLDWQNLGAPCVSSSFTIIGDDLSGYLINYAYSQQVLSSLYCSQMNITGNFESYLTQDSATGVWTDSYNQSLIYYDSNDTILFQTDSQQAVKSLYDKNGAFVSLELVTGLIMGNWINPKLIESSSEGCTNEIITNLSIYLSPNNQNLNTLSGVYYTDTVQGVRFTVPQQITQIDQLEWHDMERKFVLFYTGVSNASNQNALLLQLFNQQNTSDLSYCSYSYDRDLHFMSGTWLTDWQSLYGSNAFHPQQIQIVTVNKTYMKIYYSYSNQTLESLFYPYQSQFRDNSSILIYYEAQNSFVSTSQRVLYSPNGSLYSPDPFVGNWSDLQMQNQTESCCVPDYILISNNSEPYELSALYYFNSDMLQSASCLDFELDIQNGDLIGTLFIGFPTPTLLNWVDENQYSIRFGNDSTEKQILVAWEGTCPFVMTLQSTPTLTLTPTPEPPTSNFSLLISKSLILFTLLFTFL